MTEVLFSNSIKEKVLVEDGVTALPNDRASLLLDLSRNQGETDAAVDTLRLHTESIQALSTDQPNP